MASATVRRFRVDLEILHERLHWISTFADSRDLLRSLLPEAGEIQVEYLSIFSQMGSALLAQNLDLTADENRLVHFFRLFDEIDDCCWSPNVKEPFRHETASTAKTDSSVWMDASMGTTSIFADGGLTSPRIDKPIDAAAIFKEDEARFDMDIAAPVDNYIANPCPYVPGDVISMEDVVATASDDNVLPSVIFGLQKDATFYCQKDEVLCPDETVCLCVGKDVASSACTVAPAISKDTAARCLGKNDVSNFRTVSPVISDETAASYLVEDATSNSCADVPLTSEGAVAFRSMKYTIPNPHAGHSVPSERSDMSVYFVEDATFNLHTDVSVLSKKDDILCFVEDASSNVDASVPSKKATAFFSMEDTASITVAASTEDSASMSDDNDAVSVGDSASSSVDNDAVFVEGFSTSYSNEDVSVEEVSSSSYADGSAVFEMDVVFHAVEDTASSSPPDVPAEDGVASMMGISTSMLSFCEAEAIPPQDDCFSHPDASVLGKDPSAMLCFLARHSLDVVPAAQRCVVASATSCRRLRKALIYKSRRFLRAAKHSRFTFSCKRRVQSAVFRGLRQHKTSSFNAVKTATRFRSRRLPRRDAYVRRVRSPGSAFARLYHRYRSFLLCGFGSCKRRTQLRPAFIFRYRGRRRVIAGGARSRRRRRLSCSRKYGRRFTDLMKLCRRRSDVQVDTGLQPFFTRANCAGRKRKAHSSNAYGPRVRRRHRDAPLVFYQRGKSPLTDADDWTSRSHINAKCLPPPRPSEAFSSTGCCCNQDTKAFNLRAHRSLRIPSKRVLSRVKKRCACKGTRSIAGGDSVQRSRGVVYSSVTVWTPYLYALMLLFFRCCATGFCDMRRALDDLQKPFQLQLVFLCLRRRRRRNVFDLWRRRWQSLLGKSRRCYDGAFRAFLGHRPGVCVDKHRRRDIFHPWRQRRRLSWRPRRWSNDFFRVWLQLRPDFLRSLRRHCHEVFLPWRRRHQFGNATGFLKSLKQYQGGAFRTCPQRHPGIFKLMKRKRRHCYDFHSFRHRHRRTVALQEKSFDATRRVFRRYPGIQHALRRRHLDVSCTLERLQTSPKNPRSPSQCVTTPSQAYDAMLALRTRFSCHPRRLPVELVTLQG